MHDQTPLRGHTSVADRSEEGHYEWTEAHREKVRSFFDRDEDWQGKLYSVRSDRFARAVARRKSYAFSMLASANVVGRGNALDIGCGSGLYLEELAGLGFTAYGMDSSSAMVRCAKNMLADRASVLCGDIEHIPWRTGSFDVVLCVGVLGYLLEDSAPLREMRRVLKPNGFLLVNVENMMSISNIDYVVRRRVRRALAWLDRSRARERHPEVAIVSPWVLKDPARQFRYKLYDPWALEVLMSRLGFGLVDSMTFGFEFRILRRFGFVPESWLLRGELMIEGWMRKLRIPYLSYLGESYNALFQKHDEEFPVRSPGRPGHFRGGVSGGVRPGSLAGDGRGAKPRGFIPTE